METERERQHRQTAERFASSDLEAATAAWRAKEIDGVANREHDPTRKEEYRALAKEWHAKAKNLKADAGRQNAALVTFARG